MAGEMLLRSFIRHLYRDHHLIVWPNDSCLTFKNRIGNANPKNKSITSKIQKMKKLKSLKLDALKEVLTREQMKKITGGYNCTGNFCSLSAPCCPTFVCISGRCFPGH